GWETYERLLEEDPDRSAPRFFYERGVLEIVSPSFEHEQIARVSRRWLKNWRWNWISTW
ncbi:MAG: hypothetical protein H0T57_01510, partial [Rubrobacter sp.]|nr:hypothetical protein [Rubrobacter sp.]